MKYSIIFLTLFSGLILSACDRPADTVVVPVPDNSPDTVIVPVPTPVPGPAGAPGPVGEQGASGQTGDKGDTGKTGGDTVIIVPPAENNMPAEVVPPAN